MMMDPAAGTKEEKEKQKQSRKTAPATSSSTTSSQRPQEQALKCPRCDSANTKFCYYNNYSLTQPRHFCKTCRRYWTKGGALRNVPIGGGCRKNKKLKSSSSKLSAGGDPRDSSSDIGGFKFFHGLSPAMDFQLGALSFQRLNTTPSMSSAGFNNQFSSFGDVSSTSAPIGSAPSFNLDPSGGSSGGNLLGFNFALPPVLKQGENLSTFGAGVQEMGASVNNAHSSIASSIESLSSINQDLHWKLQQQRFAMLFGAGENHQKENLENHAVSGLNLENQIQKPQPILFQNLEISSSRPAGDDDGSGAAAGISRKDGGTGNLATEWFFDNSYGTVHPTPTNTAGNGNDQNGSTWNGVQPWNNLNQFTAAWKN